MTSEAKLRLNNSMPKKTKKQKKRALRRRASSRQVQVITHSKEQSATYQLKSKTTSTPKQSKTALISPDELTLIKKDMFKSIMLAGIAVAIELGVFYWLRG